VLEQQDYLRAPRGSWNDRTLLGRRALTRLRSGSSEPRISTGRWTALPADERPCLQCAATVETEEHFLLDCAVFADERKALFRALDTMGEHAAAAAARRQIPRATRGTDGYSAESFSRCLLLVQEIDAGTG